jgi:hypothetical protein
MSKTHLKLSMDGRMVMPPDNGTGLHCPQVLLLTESETDKAT